MTDRAYIISRTLEHKIAIAENNDQNTLLVTLDVLKEILALLKEQEDLGTELTNAVELIHKKNERIEKLLKEQEKQKFFVDESGKITPLPVVVRCKDCKWFHQAFKSEGRCIKHDDDFHEPNWVCADGERK